MTLRLSVDGVPHQIEIVGRWPHLVLRIAGRDHIVNEESGSGAHRGITIGDRRVDVVEARDGGTCFIRLAGRTRKIVFVDPRDAMAGIDLSADEIRAPMPGAVVDVHKQAGDAVKRGEAIVTIESMKLQTALSATRDGVVARICRGVNETFDKDETVATLVPLAG